MADAELVRVLDYILNRSDENSIEAVAAAVVRRKRDLAMFGSAGLPDPKAWAHKVAAEVNVNASLVGIRQTVRNMVAEMLKREAPELSDTERDELLNAWVPLRTTAAGSTEDYGSDGSPGHGEAYDSGEISGKRGKSMGRGKTGTSRQKLLPPDVLATMVHQFIAYSSGTMPAQEERQLRAELGAWPERYWEAFPQVIRSLITEYLNGTLDDGAFSQKLMASIQIATGT
ncbi:hypothetical protein [Gracilinema caldarium]|uniref:Uncharacterized protein n=1 Tax=Gracilinema caldarium (strain ATCC 51460 / DSM 7334 / H1) TaxID=744872 RepID=F8F449_GRAC1|nr:hypothetical protein [Gracilinema caldarium]AEJ20068.1 hypothetical protein Spica_1939 [Gracilinema caldarium DSM 7334]